MCLFVVSFFGASEMWRKMKKMTFNFFQILFLSSSYSNLYLCQSLYLFLFSSSLSIFLLIPVFISVILYIFYFLSFIVPIVLSFPASFSLFQSSLFSCIILFTLFSKSFSISFSLFQITLSFFFFPLYSLSSPVSSSFIHLPNHSLCHSL